MQTIATDTTSPRIDRTLVEPIAALRQVCGQDDAQGFIDTALPEVHLLWSDRAIARTALVYQPGIAIIVSGRKTGYVADARFTYDAGHYLAVGLPVCFECDTEATPEQPLVGLFLRADAPVLVELAAGIADTLPSALPEHTSLGIEPVPLGADLRATLIRLVRQLADPAQAKLLAPATLREVFFHALQDPHGKTLLIQTQPHRPEARIGALLREIEATPGSLPSVDWMAASVGMSPASFHRHFKAAFGVPPLKHLKQQRLIRAHNLLAFKGIRVTEAAHEVGYVSTSQFSRDFSGFFGCAPSQIGRMAGS